MILILGSRSLDPPILWREGVVVNARVNCRALMGRKRVVDRKMDMVGIDELMCSGEGKYKRSGDYYYLGAVFGGLDVMEEVEEMV